jgi:hypothetical protein
MGLAVPWPRTSYRAGRNIDNRPRVVPLGQELRAVHPPSEVQPKAGVSSNRCGLGMVACIPGMPTASAPRTGQEIRSGRGRIRCFVLSPTLQAKSAPRPTNGFAHSGGQGNGGYSALLLLQCRRSGNILGTSTLRRRDNGKTLGMLFGLCRASAHRLQPTRYTPPTTKHHRSDTPSAVALPSLR